MHTRLRLAAVSQVRVVLDFPPCPEAEAAWGLAAVGGDNGGTGASMALAFVAPGSGAAVAGPGQFEALRGMVVCRVPAVAGEAAAATPEGGIRLAAHLSGRAADKVRLAARGRAAAVAGGGSFGGGGRGRGPTWESSRLMWVSVGGAAAGVA